MDKVRGFAFFEYKTLEEVKEALDSLELEKAELGFFARIERNEESLDNAGVVIDGEVDGLSSVALVKMLREKLGLEEAILCDVSVESEATVKPIKSGKLSGYYSSIRIMPPYEMKEVLAAAEDLGSSMKASNILVRTAEHIEGQPVACIDISSPDEYDQEKAGKHLEGFELGFLTKFELA